MQEYEALSEVISDIYDTTLRPDIWPGVLSKAARAIGSRAVYFLSHDTRRRTANAFHVSGISADYTRAYVDQYLKLDPTVMPMRACPVGDVVSTGDLLPLRDYFDTRFYREWAGPQGWVDALRVTLEKSGGHFANVTFLRDAEVGSADARSIHFVRLIAPHLRRAVLIGNVIDLHRAKARAFSEALDGVRAGIFLVDEARGILHANAGGETMLAARDVLQSLGGYLSATTPQSDQALRAMVSAASRGDDAVGVAGIAQPLSGRSGEPYVAHIMPLTSGARAQTGQHYAAQAVLFVHKAALRLHSVPEIFAKVFKLTPGESRVLLGIVEVGGTPETAAALGLSEATVRTHLQRVFAKTGMARQADLVKLVAEFSSPLAG